jgi:hypothetical protein
MDVPVLSEVLTALAQGAGGEAGRRAWAALAGLTARICGHGSAEAQAVEAASTGSEPGRPSALADLLAQRADADPGFAAAFRPWLSAAQLLLAEGNATANQVTGGVSGSVIQARDVHGGIIISRPPGPVGPAVPRPRQIPLSTVFFTDRSAEAGTVIAAADKGQRCTMAAISGGGGMGKTALAIRVLDQLADRFPDGLFHADLAAFGPAGPADPAIVLAGWLRAAGVAAQVVPASVEEAAALWRSVTAGRPAGVLADDTASAGQVRPLVPAAGLIVVTSRHRLPQLATDGARLILLGPLPAPASADLAGKIIGRAADPGVLAALASVCGHIPVAVAAAAGQAAARPNLPVRAIVDDLAAARHHQHGHLGPSVSVEISMSLDSSYRQLPADAARAYRLLALCPGPDSTAGAAGVPVVLTKDPTNMHLSCGDIGAAAG